MENKPAGESPAPKQQQLEKPKDRKPVYAGILIILVLVLSFFLWKNAQLKKEREQQARQIETVYNQLDSVASELDMRILTIQELGGDIDSLIVLKEQLESDKKSLIRQGENQRRNLKKLNGRVAGYKELLLLKDEEIEQLKVLNEQLVTENTSLKEEKNELGASIQQLRKNAQQLEDKVSQASRLKLEGLKVYAVSSKGRERADEFRNRHIETLKVKFTVLENEIAPIEGKELLLRVIAPDQNVLFDVTRGSGSFTFEGRELFYTSSQEILYDRKAQEVAYVYDKGSDYSLGQHRVEVYTDGYLLGTGSFVVK